MSNITPLWGTPPGQQNGQAGSAQQQGGVPGAAGQYSRVKFYTRATDTKGHRRSMTVSIPPEVAGQIEVLVGSPDWPDYTSTMAFVRDSVVHNLARCLELAGDPRLQESLEETLSWYALRESGRIKKERRDQWVAVQQDFLDHFEACAADGAWESAAQHVEEYEEQFYTLPDPYRSKGLELTSRSRSRIPADRTVQH